MRTWTCVLAGLFAAGLSGCTMTGALDKPAATSSATSTTLSPTSTLEWNEIAIEASGLDSTPPGATDTRLSNEQMGPGRASRAMAIVHIAMFESLIAIRGGYESYLKFPRASSAAHHEAALARAAHDALIALFPSQKADLDAKYERAIARIPAGEARDMGVDVGRRAAEATLADRAEDGSNIPESRVGVDHTCSNDPGRWRPDPVSSNQLALGAHWGTVRPFTLTSAAQYRCTTPPALGSVEYREALQEVRDLGGDGIHTTTKRTLTQTVIGIFWGYDGGPTLCAPPRLYNQIAALIAVQQGSGLMELTRLLTLVNIAMADAGIASWESKYHHDLWRPVCAIREGGDGMGPSGQGDGDPETTGDPGFVPLGAPSSNAKKANFTPPFPSYPSGHATFGGTMFQMLRNFYGTDDIAFDFESDEFNGITTDSTGQVRPRITRHYDHLSEAEEENGQSRIYLGIHYRFDKTAGVKQGHQVADHVFRGIYRPLSTK